MDVHPPGHVRVSLARDGPGAVMELVPEERAERCHRLRNEIVRCLKISTDDGDFT